MISGYLLLILCVFLLALFAARKAKVKRAFAFLHKIHIPLGILSIVVILIHVAMTYPVWKTRQKTVLLTGILTAICIVFMLLSYLLRKRMGTSWRRAHQIGAVLILCLLVSHVVTYYADFFSYQSKMASLTTTGMTAKGIPDGSYQGECSVGYIYAKVKVEVNDQMIKSITILQHDNERGTKAEQVLPEMIKKQTTAVDAVSGASNSSHVLMKAVENALESAKK